MRERCGVWGEWRLGTCLVTTRRREEAGKCLGRVMNDDLRWRV
jgi:hypothetical protein